MIRLSSTPGLHAALVIVPATLVIGGLGIAALLFDELLRGDGPGIDARGSLSGSVAVLVVAVSALAMFLWVGQWWTEEADAPSASQPGRGDLTPPPQAGENARARQIGKARAIDRWLNEGGRSPRDGA